MPTLRQLYQAGGSVYSLESAVSDKSHSQIDRLLLEHEMSQQPREQIMRADPRTGLFGTTPGEYESAAVPAWMADVGFGGLNIGKGILKKLFPSKTAKAGKQILKEGSSKIKRASKLPEEFAQVGRHKVGVAEFTDDAGNIIKQPMYQSTGTSGYAGKRAGEWMPFLGERGGGYHKGRYALGKGGKPVSHMIDLDKYGRVMKESLSPRMKKILPSKSKFDWEARMTGPTGPDTGRMKQLSYDIKQLENKLDDLPVDDVKFEDLNKWLRKQGAELPERSWIPETYQQGGLVSAEPSSTGVHGNIDNLMLQSKLDEVYDPGVMYAPRTLGQRAAEWLPSKHRDPIKAKEQERGLQEFIDFVVPQTKTDVALELMPFGAVIKSVAKKVPEIAKMVKKAGIKSPLYHHTGMGQAEDILETGFIRGEGTFPGQKDVWPHESRWQSVSTTRDPGFLTRPHSHVGTDVSFVFDRPSLKKAGYKVKPFAESGFEKTTPIYGGKSLGDIAEGKLYKTGSKPNPSFEFEERVRGNLSLKDLKMINVASIGDPPRSFAEKLLWENKIGTPVIFSNKAKNQIRKRIDEIEFEFSHRKGQESFSPMLRKSLRKEKTTLKSLLKLPSYKSPFKKPKSKYHEKWAEEEDLLMAQGGYF